MMIIIIIKFKNIWIVKINQIYKIVINNNHNVSVNANIGGPGPMNRQQFYDED